MKTQKCLFLFLFFLALATSWGNSKTTTEKNPLLYLDFNEAQGSNIHNSVDATSFQVTPICDRISGVSGNAILFNGFTSRLILPKAQIPEFKYGFTIDLWLAPVAYPKCPCPIICQKENNKDFSKGFSLELDAYGKVSLCVAMNGQWQKVQSSTPLALKQWTRITCSFNSKSGLQLAFNGKIVASKDTIGTISCAENDIWIGRTPFKETCQLENESIPIWNSLDAALDELKIFNGTTAFTKILKEQSRTAFPAAPQFEERILPSGPKQSLAFGSWYIPLKYYKQWDEQWRGETPDVVIGFGQSLPFRVVFWRGISYAPCFVTEKQNWMSNEFVERAHVTQWGCCESMSDKHADFSSVRIVENSPARTVVLWRNSPVGVNQQFPFLNEETKWGDWSEETYIFYPDGAGVRKMVVWSSHIHDWYEWSQSLQVLHPGQRPEDVLDENKILSVANMKGESKTFGWDFQGKKTQYAPTLPAANIQVSYLKSQWNPFLILDDRDGANEHKGQGPEIYRYAGHWSDFSLFPWRNHWPVTQDYVIGRHATAPDGPSHSYTATQYNAPYSIDGEKMTKLMLCGCTDKDAGQLLPLAKSWLRAPKLNVLSANCLGGQYDLTERAYKLTAKDNSNLKLYLNASNEQPANGICLIVKGWNTPPAQVLANRKTLNLTEYKTSIVSDYEGTNMILWLDLKATSPINLEITSNQKQAESPDSNFMDLSKQIPHQK